MRLPIKNTSRPHLDLISDPAAYIALIDIEVSDYSDFNFETVPPEHTAASLAKRTSCARFCVTDNRCAGLVPPRAEEGDTVVIFHGLSVPFIISSRGLEGLHRLVGECYIHGSMYGEALELPHAEEMDFFLV